MANYETPEQPWKNCYQHFRFKLGRDSPSDARGTVLVVATLIVGVTFQAGVNPPGGVWQDNSFRTAGKSILAENSMVSYGFFVFFNTLAFSAATNAILYLMLDSPFQIEVLIAVYSMNVIYGTSVAVVTPSGILPPPPTAFCILPPILFKVVVRIHPQTVHPKLIKHALFST